MIAFLFLKGNQATSQKKKVYIRKQSENPSKFEICAEEMIRYELRTKSKQRKEEKYAGRQFIPDPHHADYTQNKGQGEP
jgi:hypothetical protein